MSHHSCHTAKDTSHDKTYTSHCNRHVTPLIPHCNSHVTLQQTRHITPKQTRHITHITLQHTSHQTHPTLDTPHRRKRHIRPLTSHQTRHIISSSASDTVMPRQTKHVIPCQKCRSPHKQKRPETSHGATNTSRFSINLTRYLKWPTYSRPTDLDLTWECFHRHHSAVMPHAKSDDSEALVDCRVPLTTKSLNARL